MSYNRKVNHNESTDEIYVPAKFQALFKDKYSTRGSSTTREDQSRPRKKYIFNLHQYDKEEEVKEE